MLPWSEKLGGELSSGVTHPKFTFLKFRIFCVPGQLLWE